MQTPIKHLLTRAVWVKAHLYLALGAGLFFSLIGLTGSISIYREAIDTFLNPQLFIETPQGKYQSLDRIMASVHAAHPKRLGSWTLEMPASPNAMITVWYDKPDETFDELYAPLMVSVNPYTAEVVASRFWGQTAVTWLLDLHTQLRLDRWGWNAVGVLGLLLALSVISGLYLWWPGIGKFWQAFRVRTNAGMILMLFDLHRITGLLSAGILLLLALTGFNLSYPSVLEKLAGATGMAHGETGRNIISTANPNNHPVGLESAEFIARGLFPRAQLRRVTTPAGNAGIYRINLRQSSEINQKHPFTTVWVDRWSGQIKEVRNPGKFSSGEAFTAWIWPLHTGEAVGATGRFLWFVAGLTPLFLYISGLLRWLHRLGKVQDTEVNFAPLRALCYQWLKATYHFSLQAFILLLEKAKPVIIAGYKRLFQWLQHIRSNLK